MTFSCVSYLTWVLIITSYMLGAIPFGLIITSFLGHGDIRKHGSGNIGTTNVLRRTGKIGGVLTLALDAGKGAFAIYLAQNLCPDYLLMIVCGMAAFLGHIFPVWLNFKGGKGVATGFAVLIYLQNLVGFVAIGIWLLAFVMFRVSAIAALTSYCIIPFATYVITRDPRLTIAISIMSLLVVIRHQSNIKKMIKGN